MRGVREGIAWMLAFAFAAGFIAVLFVNNETNRELKEAKAIAATGPCGDLQEVIIDKETIAIGGIVIHAKLRNDYTIREIPEGLEVLYNGVTPPRRIMFRPNRSEPQFYNKYNE